MITTAHDTQHNTSPDANSKPFHSSMVAYTPITQQQKPIFFQTHKIDGRYFADILMEPDLPHHGEGATPDEAMDSLSEALKSSWQALHSAQELSTHMEKRRQRLEVLFHSTVTNTFYHGEGTTPDEAMDSLPEALKSSWQPLHSTEELSTHMEKRLFHSTVTDTF